MIGIPALCGEEKRRRKKSSRHAVRAHDAFDGELSLSGGEFRVALSDDKVIGTIGLMLKARQCAVLKKIFVQKKFCSQGVGLALYNTLLTYAKGADIRHIIPPPSVARVSHRFYERAGFYKIAKNQLPISYIYPDRDSILY